MNSDLDSHACRPQTSDDFAEKTLTNGTSIETVHDGIVYVRFGAIPDVARFDARGLGDLPRGTTVVVESQHGLELGTVLETYVPSPEPGEKPAFPDMRVMRRASEEDFTQSQLLQTAAQQQFQSWEERIREWNLDLQLIDLQWTLDQQKLVLYVLNERGPECTKLALQAAAHGLGSVEVQPVGQDGPMTLPAPTGGCGSGSGGCGSCHAG